MDWYIEPDIMTSKYADVERRKNSARTGKE
jgi:hypothetical protein